jgi:osmotically-inducible protein OsmY
MAERWEDRSRSEFRDDRNYPDRDRNDRGMVDRAGDEVRSWFGDDEAARRRRMDEARDERRDREWSDRTANSAERGWDRTRETVRDMTDRDRDGRRGFAEWNDNDRTWDRPREQRTSYGEGSAWVNSANNMARDRSDYWNRDRGDYRTRERSFGDTSRYASADPYGTPSSASQMNTGWNSGSSGPHREWLGPSYVGRGPRGYQRGDERIREDVCDRLTDDPRIDASDMDVQVKGGEVTLAGSVRTRDEKRYTEDLIERITGVREVNNNLKVRPADEVLGTARSGASSVLGLTDTPPPQPTRQTREK